MNNKRLTKTHLIEEEIKKSRFICICSPIKSIEDFDAFLASNQVPEATHNCWAYRLGQNYRFDDDGEPSGTAGKPILSAIENSGFDNIMALVVRHYGGIKLGTGGLARAYGGITTLCLKQAPYEHYIDKNIIEISLPFALEQSLHQLLKKHKGTLINNDYSNNGITATVEIPQQDVHRFTKTVQNISKGMALLKINNQSTDFLK